jgi:ABC-type multidrug transport system fused ATPase/permease subunit
MFNKLANTKFWFIFINVLVVYSLIADYIRVIFFSKSLDIFFDVLTIFVFLVFVLEMIMYTITLKNYLWSFYFWNDLISTLLLIVDIVFISNAIFYGGDTSGNQTSDIITRLGKYFRIIRLIRLLKLLKDTPQRDNEAVENEEFKRKKKSIRTLSFHNSNSPRLSLMISRNSQFRKKVRQKKEPKTVTKEKRKESRVAKKMKELTSRKLIILMLLMLIFVPLLDFTNFINWDREKLELLHHSVSSLFKDYANTTPLDRYT